MLDPRPDVTDLATSSETVFDTARPGDPGAIGCLELNAGGRILAPRRRSPADAERERCARRAYYRAYGDRLSAAEVLTHDPQRGRYRRPMV